MNATPASKVCTACKQDKKLDDFPRLKTGKFGRGAKCKPCVLAVKHARKAADPEGWRQLRSKYAREARQRDPAKLQARYERWHAKNKQKVAERMAAYGVEYRRRNAERIRANQKAWSAANPDKKAQYQRSYVERYPERYAARLIVAWSALSVKDIPRGLIELKMESIQLKRLSKNVKQTLKELENETSGNDARNG